MKIRKIIIVTTVFVVSIAAFYFAPLGNHWVDIFRPATLKFIHLENPYAVDGFFNPPWGLIPLIPFSYLPERLGSAILSSLSLWGFSYIAYRFGARKWILVAYIAMPLTFFNILNINLDIFVALGFLLPPRWGLCLVLLKPQLGIGIGIYWFIMAFKSGGLKRVASTFAPASLLFIASLLIYGNYIQKSAELLNYRQMIWHISIPVGLILLTAALRMNQSGYAIAAGPFFAPYIMPYSMPIALLGLIDNPYLAIPAILGLTIIVIDPAELFILSPWLFGY